MIKFNSSREGRSFIYSATQLTYSTHYINNQLRQLSVCRNDAKEASEHPERNYPAEIIVTVGFTVSHRRCTISYTSALHSIMVAGHEIYVQLL